MNVNSFKPFVSGLRILAAGGCFVMAFTCGGAPPKATNSTSGYLPKSAPAGLRFAPPPKPRPDYLPPLPITPEPQPTGLFDSAPLTTNVTIVVTNVVAPVKAPKGGAMTETARSERKAAKSGKKEMMTAEPGRVSPEMLLRFFPNGKPAGMEMLVNDPVNFQAPIRERPSSSAGYEVK